MDDRCLRACGDLIHGRRVWFLVGGLLVIHACLLGYGAWVHSPTFDEPGHLVAGLGNWESGRFELDRVNPPLTRMMAALPVMAREAPG